MRVPAFPRGVVPFVALEGAGIVDQHADRAERGGGGGQQGGDLGLPRQVGLQRHGAAAERPDRGGGVRRLGLAAGVVDGDVEAGFGQRERDGAAEALRAAGDQRGAGDRGGDGEAHAPHLCSSGGGARGACAAGFAFSA